MTCWRKRWPTPGATGCDASEMSRNFKLIIEYDGTRFSGWQRQPEKPTIQGEIERVLERIACRAVVLKGSGRTDAGVHALGQTANFHCDTRLTPGALRSALNSLLPADIVIRDCCEVPDSFHARYDVLTKTYHYRILNHPIPSVMERHFSWHIRKALDIGAM